MLSAVPSATFYYDFNSPYAYLAAERLDKFVPDAEWRPIAFAILLNQLGELDERLTNLNTAPIVEEVTARAADRGLPAFAPPDAWPVQSWSLAPLRAALLADELGRQREFGLAAFRKAFVESRLLSEVPNVLAAAADAGLDPDEIAAGIQREDVKERLKQNTTEALERGVTGIPTVAIGDELFWGDDHLEEAASVTKQLRGLTP
jgi:2-hydroxychromene-2-carboxylate isomerase